MNKILLNYKILKLLLGWGVGELKGLKWVEGGLRGIYGFCKDGRGKTTFPLL